MVARLHTHFIHIYTRPHARLVFNGEESAEEPPVKAVVFSQWTFMLDLIEKALKARGWGYVPDLNARKARPTRRVMGMNAYQPLYIHTNPHPSYARLDGATPQPKREAALADFAGKRSVRVMIISLKAGWVPGGKGIGGVEVLVCEGALCLPKYVTQTQGRGPKPDERQHLLPPRSLVARGHRGTVSLDSSISLYHMYTAVN